MRKKQIIDVFKKYYKDEKIITTQINEIRRLYDLKEKNQYTIDDQTWDDLEMDSVFYRVDRTNSSLGQSALYFLLRNPIFSESTLKSRGNTLNKLKENKDVRALLQYIFFRTGYDKKNNLLKMLQKDFMSNKFKVIIYNILRWVPLILIMFTIILMDARMLIAAGVSMLINGYICECESKNVVSNGLVYLKDIFSTTKKILSIDDNNILENKEKIKELYNDLQDIKRNIRMINIVNMYGGFLEPLLVPFLIMESSYYNVIDKLAKKKHKVLELYYELGKIEAYISMSIYKETLYDNCCEPQFINEIELEIEEGVHPVLKNPVSNSILLNKKGVVLTGTNMSGKSTFLRMLGINILFSQTFYFALCKKYRGTFLNIVSSISPNDDINEGKSYYMAEAEAILRIVKSLDKDIPVLCIIDEIFRGTNPVERIAASASILKYINSKNAITFVATHDRELTDILKSNYDFYYFSENVNNEGLSFDYKIKEGISKTRNAIKVLDYLGYPKEITNLARIYAEGK